MENDTEKNLVLEKRANLPLINHLYSVHYGPSIVGKLGTGLEAK